MSYFPPERGAISETHNFGMPCTRHNTQLQSYGRILMSSSIIGVDVEGASLSDLTAQIHDHMVTLNSKYISVLYFVTSRWVWSKVAGTYLTQRDTLQSNDRG